MKIIISPSKTITISKSIYLKDSKIVFPEKHQKILSLLQKISKEQLKKIMKINKKLLDTTYDNIQNYNMLPTLQAFEGFNGLVFKGLKREEYQFLEYNYIKSNIVILDAFYGILLPGNVIKPYRLDMKMKIGVDLYSFWDVNKYFENEMIINLASKEFSKMITSKNIINICFLEHINNAYVNKATYSKQARGQFLNFLISNQIIDLELMKKFNKSNYLYNQALSNDLNIVFTRWI